MKFEPPPSEPSVLDKQVETLCRTAFEGILLVNDGRRYVYVNDPASDLLGVPAEAVVGLRMEQFTPPDRLPLVERLWAALKRAGELEGRGPVLSADGSQTFVEWRARWGLAPGHHLFALHAIGPPGLRRHPADGDPLPRLTPRELEVLQLAVEGRSTGDIAGLLVVSPGTVKTHFQHIYAKLGARDRVSAVATALRLGLVS